MSINTNFESYSRILNIKSDKCWKRKKWVNKDPLRQRFMDYCHWGQLKLFYSELEFLTICSNKLSLNECVIIYVGAAPGTHIDYLRDYFPEPYWILYDPARFHIKNSDKVSIFTERKGFFNDSSVSDVLSHPFVLKSKYILFISDIRVDTKEENIFKEMLDQQRWVINLNATISMLKFRLPYTLEGENSNWSYDLTDIRDKICMPSGPCPKKDYSLCYLKGDIYTQIYPPSFSTETRLIIHKEGKKYKFCNYDTIKYEEKCLYYNLFTRRRTMVYKESNKLKNHIMGIFENNYETCSQYFIVESYLKSRQLSTNLSSICTLMYNILIAHNNIGTGIGNFKFCKSLATCQLWSIKQEKVSKYLVDVRLNKEEIQKYIEQLKKIYNKIQQNIDNQIESFKKETLLDTNIYNKQINILVDSKKINGIILDDILVTIKT
jgi:hypothetical protein